VINKRQSGLTSVAEDSTDRQGSDQLTDRMVSEINALCKTATLQFALSVGDLVIQRLYLGDMDRWRSRDPTKKMSLRKIARHPSLAMSPAMLYGCIAIYELCERLDIKTWRHISTSHMRLALPLKHEEQARLLRLAESDRWSVRRLEEEVAALTRGCMPEQKGGRSRLSPLRKSIGRLSNSVAALEDALHGLEDPTEPSPDSVRAAMDVLQRATGLLAVAERRLAQAEQRVGSAAPCPSSASVAIDGSKDERVADQLASERRLRVAEAKQLRRSSGE
jgi:hypothetical protein